MGRLCKINLITNVYLEVESVPTKHFTILEARIQSMDVSYLYKIRHLKGFCGSGIIKYYVGHLKIPRTCFHFLLREF